MKISINEVAYNGRCNAEESFKAPDKYWWLVELECSPHHNAKLEKKYFAETNIFNLSFIIQATDRIKAKEFAEKVTDNWFVATDNITSIKMLDRKLCEGSQNKIEHNPLQIKKLNLA